MSGESLADKKRKVAQLQREIAAEEHSSDAAVWEKISALVVKSAQNDRLRDLARSEALRFDLKMIVLDTHISGWWNSSLDRAGTSRFGMVVFCNSDDVVFRCTGTLVRAARRDVTFDIQREGFAETKVSLETATGRKKFFQSSDGKKAWPFSTELFRLAESGGEAVVEEVALCLKETCKTWFERLATVLESENEHVQEAWRRNRFCAVGLDAALAMLQ